MPNQERKTWKMYHRAAPSFSYATEGLIAHFHGEDDYADGSWTDRISGYKFTPVSASTAPVHDAENKLYEAKQFGGMKGSFKVPGGVGYSIEFVFRDIKNMKKNSIQWYATLIGANMSGWDAANGVLVSKSIVDGEEVFVVQLKSGKTNVTLYTCPFSNFDTDDELTTVSVVPGVGIFIDGVKVSDCATTGASGNIGLFTNYDQANADSYKATGKIHAVRYYDRALTTEEVLQNYQADLNIYGK